MEIIIQIWTKILLKLHFMNELSNTKKNRFVLIMFLKIILNYNLFSILKRVSNFFSNKTHQYIYFYEKINIVFTSLEIYLNMFQLNKDACSDKMMVIFQASLTSLKVQVTSKKVLGISSGESNRNYHAEQITKILGQ